MEKRFNIPPILLEGDSSPTPKVAGPGARYALGALAPAKPAAPAPTELPAGYGTRRLFLAARDPHWLYASWDLTPEQQREMNQRSRDGHLVLRVFANDDKKVVVPEVHTNPESRTFFINVPFAETRYRAELGLYTHSGKWETVTISAGTFTPPEAPANETAVEFATIPAHVTFEQVVETVQQFVTGNTPLLEAVLIAQERQKAEATAVHVAPPPQPIEVPPTPRLEPVSAADRAEPRPSVPTSSGPPPPASAPASAPAPSSPHERARSAPPQAPFGHSQRNGRAERAEIPIKIEPAAAWTPERTLALARLISIDSYRRVWMGSIEITELVRRQLEEEISSIAAAERARAAAAEVPGAAEVFGISSPFGGGPPGNAPGRRFWFKVNAELILYGATEPDARVTIADRAVKLRPDGTFSFRFALPDGRYNLPAAATSADQVETREAILEFSRSTEYQGHVPPHPQDPALKAPRPENL